MKTEFFPRKKPIGTEVYIQFHQSSHNKHPSKNSGKVNNPYLESVDRKEREFEN